MSKHGSSNSPDRGLQHRERYDRCAPRNRDAVDRHVLDRIARFGTVDRAAEPQTFLYCTFDERGVRAQARKLIRMRQYIRTRLEIR